jgi:hypothetical protein
VIQHLEDAGLSKPSIIRMKIFTLDNRFIEEKIGHLARSDKRQFLVAFHALFGNPPV